jgi:hypothetical protein
MKIPFLIAAAAVLSAPAFAQQLQPDPHGDDLFALLDEDQSDGINPEEAQASPTVVQAFSRADTNHDGILTREEFHAAFPSTTRPQTPSRSPPPPE